MEKVIGMFLLLIVDANILTSAELSESLRNVDSIFTNYDDSSLVSKCGNKGECRRVFNEDIFNRIMKKRPAEMKMFSSDSDHKRPTLIAYDSTRPRHCSCDMDFRLLDLGHLYFPRYLHTGVCSLEGCGGFLRCKERHYKVRVLKKKEQVSSELSGTVDEAELPESLREDWQSEIVKVTVGCECAL